MQNQEPTNWEGREYTVDFTDIFPDGRAGGDAGGRMAVSLGALPGEQAQVRVAKHRRGQLLCDVLSLTGKSAERMEPREEHYRWCSPWQIASYDTQLRYKQQLITRSFAGTGIGEVLVTPSPDQWKYRTRIEFGVLAERGSWFLTLHGHSSSILAPDGCALASNSMNKAALSALLLCQQQNISPTDIKSIVVRESKTRASVLVIVYVFPDSLPSLSQLPDSASSLLVAQADPDRIISTPKKILQTMGEAIVSEDIAGLHISYPFDAFFQNNIPLYGQALADIQAALPPVNNLVDMYAGVGTIGLSLHQKAKRITAYEVGPVMVAVARANAARNNIAHYEARALSDLNITPEHISQAEAVIINPTRRGLSKEAVQAIRASQPGHIVYLSCNHQTQARDTSLLGDMYAPTLLKAYDFYPHTPHVETLLILQKK